MCKNLQHKTNSIKLGFTLLCVFCNCFFLNGQQLLNRQKKTASYKYFLSNASIFEKKQKEKAFEQYIKQFSDQEKIAQLFMVNIDGLKEYSSENDYNEGIAAGSYLFFSYNIAPSPASIISFTDSILHYYEKSIPPLLAIDHEGGMVNRLRSVTSPLPSQFTISQQCTEEEASLLYENAALQLRLLGFTFNLSPVSEPLLSINKDFLQDRSYGSIDAAINFSINMIKSYNKHSVLCAIKHFPGNTNDDPHTALPLITVDEDFFFSNMIYPFEQILKNSTLHTAVLLSHAVIPSITDNKPACFSLELVTDILKDTLGFTGLVLTDDIFMAAIADNGYDSYKAVESALFAGADMIMSSQKRCIHLINHLLERQQYSPVLRKQIEEKFRKIIRIKIETELLRYHKTSNYDIFLNMPSVNEYVVVNSESGYSPSQRLNLFQEAKNKGGELYSALFTKD